MQVEGKGGERVDGFECKKGPKLKGEHPQDQKGKDPGEVEVCERKGRGPEWGCKFSPETARRLQPMGRKCL